jgi:hypothetical protein
MNDIKSLLIATTVLAIGGLGLYMYKSEENELDYENDFSETETNSDLGSELSSEDFDNLEELEHDDYKPKKQKKEGTKKNTKKNSGTRKKY